MDGASYEDCLELSAAGEPVLVSGAEIAETCREHGHEPHEYWEEMERVGADGLDAANLFFWLGY